MPIEIAPDDKDWTWVLERPCPECGFDASTLAARDVPDLIRANASQWLVRLDAPADVLRQRPRTDRWSTLEYAAHVRDVFRRFLDRVVLMRSVDDPLFENWDQDATAIAERYNEQDPTVVAAEVVEAGDRLASAFEQVATEEWPRPGRRSDGSVFTIETLARYMIHDPVHHLWDVDHPE